MTKVQTISLFNEWKERQPEPEMTEEYQDYLDNQADMAIEDYLFDK